MDPRALAHYELGLVTLANIEGSSRVALHLLHCVSASALQTEQIVSGNTAAGEQQLALGCQEGQFHS